jgi:hypothetical protein
MATTLSSKVFDSLSDEGLLNDIAGWLAEAAVDKANCRLRLTLEAVDEKRQKKTSARRTLESIAVDGDFNWTHGDYDFRFMAKKYFWKGEEVYLTAGEALHFYRALVLKEVRWGQCSYLYNIRKRLGKEFLADAQAASTAPSTPAGDETAGAAQQEKSSEEPSYEVRLRRRAWLMSEGCYDEF